jgi:hypothetical protein
MASIMAAFFGQSYTHSISFARTRNRFPTASNAMNWARFLARPPFGLIYEECGYQRQKTAPRHHHGQLRWECSRRVTLFFIASHKAGMADRFGIGKAHCRGA